MVLKHTKPLLENYSKHLPLTATSRKSNQEDFIPAVTEDRGKERLLISLTTRYGGLDIPIFYETAEIEFMKFNKITSERTILIKKPSIQCDIHKDNLKELKTKIKKSKEEN